MLRNATTYHTSWHRLCEWVFSFKVVFILVSSYLLFVYSFLVFKFFVNIHRFFFKFLFIFIFLFMAGVLFLLLMHNISVAIVFIENFAGIMIFFFLMLDHVCGVIFIFKL
jgi:hypothetical protein